MPDGWRRLCAVGARLLNDIGWRRRRARLDVLIAENAAPGAALMGDEYGNGYARLGHGQYWIGTAIAQAALTLF